MYEKDRLLYQLHAKTTLFKRRLKQAQSIIADGLATMKRPYASMSFGKDSLVMVHLLPDDIPVMYVNCGEMDEWPDTPRVKHEFLSRFPREFIELSAPSIMSAYLEVGVYIQDEEQTAEQRRAQSDYGKSLGDVLDKAAKERFFDGAFIGVRKEESDNRSRLFAMRGPLYFAKIRALWACHPLAFWTARDVWGYIVEHDLPYNELYDLAPEGRELARNGAMFGTRSMRYGRVKFLQRMYPDWFNQFADQFPEVRAYV